MPRVYEEPEPKSMDEGSAELDMKQHRANDEEVHSCERSPSVRAVSPLHLSR